MLKVIIQQILKNQLKNNVNYPIKNFEIYYVETTFWIYGAKTDY